MKKKCHSCAKEFPGSYRLCPSCGEELLVEEAETKKAKNIPKPSNVPPLNPDTKKPLKNVNRFKGKHRLKPWAIWSLFGILTISTLLFFKAGVWLAEWKVNSTSPAEEVELTVSQLRNTNIENWTYEPNHELSLLVDNVGQRLVNEIPNSPYNYKFHVINDSSINAFAMPGGYIFIHDGLLYELESEDELAAVIAHEIMHVEEKHGLKGFYQSMSTAAMLSWSLGLSKDTGIQALSSLLDKKYSRSNETEADIYGVSLMRRAGFEKDSAISMLHKLDDGSKQTPEWLNSHPDISTRIENIEEVYP